MNENVILVDEQDQEIGVMEKLEAHQKGMLHRAISVFVFDTQGRMMLQRRAASKYHCGGLWTNTCCSHPRQGEEVLAAAHRRLQEEMGFDCPLTETHAFTYRVEFPNGLTEHEYDHVLIGISDTEPILNPEEVDDWNYITIEELDKELAEHPERYTYWFKVAFPEVIEQYHRLAI